MDDLTPRQLQILRIIQESPCKSIRAIGREAGVSYQRVQQVIEFLATQGLIKERRAPRPVKKTNQRLEAIERARQAHKDAIGNYFKDIHARS